MSKLAKIMAMSSMFASVNDPYRFLDRKANVQGYTSMTEDEKMKAKGLTKFHIKGDVWVWALNEENAIKKFNKRKNKTT